MYLGDPEENTKVKYESVSYLLTKNHKEHHENVSTHFTFGT